MVVNLRQLFLSGNLTTESTVQGSSNAPEDDTDGVTKAVCETCGNGPQFSV